MKIHLVCIRVTAAAGIAAGVGVHPATAQVPPRIGQPARNPPRNRQSHSDTVQSHRARRSRILSRSTRNRRIRKHNPPRTLQGAATA